MGRMIRDESRNEERAALIVSILTGCQSRRLDLGTGRPQPDYALLDSTGREIGVLEVTSISRPDINSFFSERNKQNRRWCSQLLKWEWFVTVDNASRRLSGLKHDILEMLVKFEQDGTTHAVARKLEYKSGVAVIPEGVAQKGVVEVCRGREHTDSPGGVDIVLRAEGSVDSVDSVESATVGIEGELNKRDNRRKLDVRGERRELFVWVDPPGPVARSLSTFVGERERSQVADSRPPELPKEVTAVWAALWSGDVHRLADALWRGDAEGWKVMKLPTGPANGTSP